MSKKSIAAALTAREQDRAFREGQTIGGYAPGFEGPPAAPPETSPEQQAAVALARARFAANEIANFRPPKPGAESGVSKFSQTGFGRSFLSSKAIDRNDLALSGQPELERVERGFEGAARNVGLTEKGLALSDRQRGLDEEMKVKAVFQKALPTPEGTARAVREAGVITGNPNTLLAGLQAQRQAFEYKQDMEGAARKESSRKLLDTGFQELAAQGRGAEPRALAVLALNVATKTGDYGFVAEASSRISGLDEDEDQRDERALRLSILTKQNRNEDSALLSKMHEDTISLMGKIPGLGLDDAVASMMLIQGKRLPAGLDADYQDSMESLREPLRRLAQIQEKFQEKKLGEDDVARRKALQDEYNNYYDPKTGKPMGWLLNNKNKPSGIKDRTIGELFDRYFLDRQNEFLGGTGSPSQGFDVDTLDALGGNQRSNQQGAAQAPVGPTTPQGVTGLPLGEQLPAPDVGLMGLMYGDQ